MRDARLAAIRALSTLAAAGIVASGRIIGLETGVFEQVASTSAGVTPV